MIQVHTGAQMGSGGEKETTPSSPRPCNLEACFFHARNRGMLGGWQVHDDVCLLCKRCFMRRNSFSAAHMTDY
jgi:Fe-S-cluster-containing hydrogenase component 2